MQVIYCIVGAVLHGKGTSTDTGACSACSILVVVGRADSYATIAMMVLFYSAGAFVMGSRILLNST